MNSAASPTLLQDRMGDYARVDWHDYYRHFIHLVPERARVLDVGSGRGGAAEWLVKNKGCEVLCVDASHEALEACRAKGLATHQADLNGGQWGVEGAFDLVLFSSSLESMTDPLGLVKQVQQNLRPGGTLLIWLPNFSYIGSRLAYLIGRSVKYIGYGEAAQRLGVWGYDDIQFFTKASLGHMLEEAGYRNLRWHLGWAPLDIRSVRNPLKKLAFWVFQEVLRRRQPDALSWFLCVAAERP